MNEMQNYYKHALLNGLCSDYKGRWQVAMKDKEKLFNLAMCQQSLPHMCTYAYKGDGLTKEYIEQQFGDFINGKYTSIDADGVIGNYKTQMYVGYSAHLSLSNDVTAFLWCDVPTLQFEAIRAEKIYVACKSKVNISCDGYNNIVVMLFDESEIVLDDIDEDSTILVYRYSNNSKVEKGKYCFGRVKVFDKELVL